MALRRIALRDFVIVRALEIDLCSGFTVLTGETGAGKSILIDALQLALGNRADAGAVREGAERLDVSAEFDADPALAEWLDEGGFEAGDALLLRRTVDLQGRSRGWINGSPATATQLRELGDHLLDIHGQHAWQSLTRPDAVRGLLDAYAGVRADTLDAAWQAWRQALGTLATARSAQDSLQRERERLQWQIAEVQKLAPGADEWDELSANHSRASNAQALIDAAGGARAALEDEDQGALVALNRALTLLQDCEHIEPEFKALSEVLASSVAQAADAAHSLHGYLRHTDTDPRHLADLDERMGLWMSLARRYKRTPVELPGLLASWQTELKALDAQSDLEGLERAEQAAQQVYMKEAKALGKVRKQAAPKLAQAVTQAMQGLGMQGGRFDVALQPLAQPGRAGLEEVAFLVAGHPGSTPRPIGKVASGGELSRVALAIAVTTSELGTAQTLIFDEVDAGVGGAVAETVGRLMQQLGRDRQVLAVTHLPQVAACADHHLLVAKRAAPADGAGGPRTESGVSTLAAEARTREIARMLGGERSSATSLAHAREMLERQSVGAA
ncbi:MULTISPECIES: DNA repair protein RecN [unclassified Variovorax]|uniref:DNA repair protein RecN n=1 Tax=unclassified Variovorax TaxID=663243 RepID=UPI0025755D84|nr:MULTISPECIES: DNA repair protein RecN [unclassified Variovorax]MDM0091644.1 DNA repair protein RecN [Variovorax sp. J22G40]MDM0146001.1 DNA repair protein RecN [Variovorax sp. J2P1-31]